MTSGGSSGRPKMIVDMEPGAVDISQPLLNLPQGGTVLNAGPLCHNAPFTFMSMALHHGNSVISMPRFDAEEALRLIERHGVTWANRSEERRVGKEWVSRGRYRWVQDNKTKKKKEK